MSKCPLCTEETEMLCYLESEGEEVCPECHFEMTCEEDLRRMEQDESFEYIMSEDM